MLHIMQGRRHPRDPRRRRTLRGLLPLRGGLPGGLHRAAGHRGRNRARLPEFFRINFSRCIFCGFCEEACPTYAIQLTPEFEMCEYERSNMVYEKETC
jgi:NAD-dependent dihydropyrimidine dehydrogenase PreA subunit